MRKIRYQVGLSLDGYFEGPDSDISWHRVDEEFNQYALDMLRGLDTMLFGRVTYELMVGYWPKVEAGSLPVDIPSDNEVAKMMNRTKMIVYSKTLKSLDNPMATLRHEVDAEEIRAMKQQPGLDISVGSSILASQLAHLGLIDEYHIVVMPVFLGKGRSLFDTLPASLNLKLVSTRTFRNGNVELVYHPG